MKKILLFFFEERNKLKSALVMAPPFHKCTCVTDKMTRFNALLRHYALAIFTLLTPTQTNPYVAQPHSASFPN